MIPLLIHFVQLSSAGVLLKVHWIWGKCKILSFPEIKKKEQKIVIQWSPDVIT